MISKFFNRLFFVIFLLYPFSNSLAQLEGQECLGGEVVVYVYPWAEVDEVQGRVWEVTGGKALVRYDDGVMGVLPRYKVGIDGCEDDVAAKDDEIREIDGVMYTASESVCRVQSGSNVGTQCSVKTSDKVMIVYQVLVLLSMVLIPACVVVLFVYINHRYKFLRKV